VAWLEAGVHIKAVADLLGHSSISVTGDIYGHTSDATNRPALMTSWRAAPMRSTTYRQGRRR